MGVFIGALIVNSRDGWVMNWNGRKDGEGIEYFVTPVSLLLLTILKGGSALAVDLWLTRKIAMQRRHILVTISLASSAIAEMVLSFFFGLCIERNLKSGKASSIRKIENFMAALRSL